MDGIPKWRVVLLFLPALLGPLIPSLSVQPQGKMWIVTTEAAFAALLFLCMTIHDLVRRVSYRPAIPLVWLTLAVSFGCISMGLRTMAQTWGLRRAHLPFTQVASWLDVGMLFLLVGVIGFGMACQKRARMSAQGR
jgi:hypothetical protein